MTAIRFAPTDRKLPLIALVLLLFIPLLIASSWGTLNLLASGQQQQRLRGLPVTLSGPTTPADLALPFPERRRRILEGLDRSEQQLARSSAPAPIPWLALLESSLRVVPTALALAAGFGTLALGAGSYKRR